MQENKVLYDLRARLNVAKGHNKWLEVNQLAHRIISEFPSEAVAWDYYWKVRALYELNELSEAFVYAVKMLDNFPGFKYVEQLLASILAKLIAQTDELNILTLHLDVLQRLTNARDFTKAKALLVAVKKFFSVNQYNLALKYLKRFAAINFSEQRYRTVEGRYLPSQWDKYQFAMVKALFKTHKYQELTDYARDLEIDQIHKLYRPWVKYYIAVAQWYMDCSSALWELFDVKKQLKFWKIDYYISLCLFKNGFLQQALYFAATSLLGDNQDLWYKTEALELLAEIYQKQGNKQTALAIIKFILKEYEEHGYVKSRKYLELKERYGTEIEAEIQNVNKIKDIKKIVHSALEDKFYEGTIESIKGNFGFIKVSDSTLYFHIGNFKSDKKFLSPGLKVRFNIGWNYDFKKGELSKQAINIQVIEE